MLKRAKAAQTFFVKATRWLARLPGNETQRELEIAQSLWPCGSPVEGEFHLKLVHARAFSDVEREKSFFSFPSNELFFLAFKRVYGFFVGMFYFRDCAVVQRKEESENNRI